MTQKVLVFTPSGSKVVPISGMLCLGGADSTGFCFSDLNFSGDYAVVSPMDGRLCIHVLRTGQQSKTVELSDLERVQIEDLTVIALPSVWGSDVAQNSGLIQSLEGLLESFVVQTGLHDQLSSTLKKLVDFCEAEKGAIVTRDPKATDESQYRIVARENLDGEDGWLSESFFQITLESKQPQAVLNLIGSSYSRNESLMASGFLSVFSWPLMLRGEVFGMLLIGSRKPHSGLSMTQQQTMKAFVTLVSLMTQFVLRDQEMREHIQKLRQMQNPNQQPLLSSSPKLIEACALAEKIAPTDLSVLIQGETGVGKEVLARWVHDNSDRKHGPFVAVNCGAIPSELLESVLFGHRRGAFTGAISDQVGKFQLASRGTLFLDELGDLPQALQVKLLRALQERIVEPIGANKGVPVDVRVISATHKNLQEMMSRGVFREDLFFRLAEIQIQIPALRERPEDIELLAHSHLERLAPGKRLSRESRQWMLSQQWKGNVRELISSLRRAAVLSRGDEIQVTDLTAGQPQMSAPVHASFSAMNLDKARDEFVRQKIMQALAVSHGHRHNAAQLLGITPRTLFRYLKELDIGSDRTVTIN
jgi:DNA-binding NtrC family response regulator